MERLTERIGDYVRIKGCKTLYGKEERREAPACSAIARLAMYEDAMPFERAQEFAQAEKDGRLVVIFQAPPKVGDTIYEVIENKSILENQVKYIDLNRMTCCASSNEGGLIEFYLFEIGKTVFLTREEAEAELKKREAENAAD